MNLDILLWLLIVATVVATYVFWIRPVLKTTPSLGYLYADEEAFFAALGRKFDGLKQKLVTAVVAAAAFVVSTYDFIAPLVAQSGVDVTTLTDKVPAQAWPIIGIALVLLLQYLRKVGDRSLLAKMQPGDPLVTLDAPTLTPAIPVAPKK
ncbi:MAG: hypothetical protein ACREGR_04515 [Minisyncoccia bacterium]